MCGYFTQSGYWGLVGNEYMQFASDSDYYEYLADRKEKSK